MEARRLVVERRNITGKGAARKLRAQGKIPGICYGKGSEPVMLALAPNDLLNALDKEKGANTLLKLEIAGEEPEEKLVLLKDKQMHPLSRKLLHADFIEVKEGQRIKVEVPLLLTGKSKGVKAGGTLSQPRRRILVECTPDKIPGKIELDVTDLDLGDSIHIDELELPEGVEAVYEKRFTVAVVVAPSSVKEEKAEAEVPEEGAPAGEGKAEAEKKAEGSDKKEGD